MFPHQTSAWWEMCHEFWFLHLSNFGSLGWAVSFATPIWGGTSKENAEGSSVSHYSSSLFRAGQARPRMLKQPAWALVPARHQWMGPIPTITGSQGLPGPTSLLSWVPLALRDRHCLFSAQGFAFTFFPLQFFSLPGEPGAGCKGIP